MGSPTARGDHVQRVRGSECDLVDDPPTDPQLVEPIALEPGDRLGARAQLLGERRRRGRQVDEDEAGVGLDSDRVERVVGPVEQLVL